MSPGTGMAQTARECVVERTQKQQSTQEKSGQRPSLLLRNQPTEVHK